VPPGSALLADPTSSEWVGELDEEGFTYRWESPDPRLDRLQREVAAIAEEAATNHEPERSTFGRIWAAAFGAARLETPAVPQPKQRRPTPPRLTESWFC